MELVELLDKGATRISDVDAWLRDRPWDARLSALRGLGRREQRRMYGLAALSDALTLGDLVPESVAAKTAVRHMGKNTLPLPPAFRTFEKPMCRPEGDDRRLYGFNEGASRGIIGPGYFVAYEVESNPVWSARGDVVVDYFQVPDGAVAPEWPKVVPNSEGLQKFVFKGTRDFLRKVSDGVSIGAAFKGERPLDHYFVLLRRED